MIKALLLDCNGIIADDEPIHLRLFQRVLMEEGIRLTRKEYFKRYLALDDRNCFQECLRLHRRPASIKIIRDLIARKSVYYNETIKEELRIFPGVRSFVHRHRKLYALAVVSGALRSEIDWILSKAGIDKAFSVIISAESVQNGKPNPESYLLALKSLRKLPIFRKNGLKPEECLAIEDSIHGIEASHKAGMKCLAITNSYSKTQLRHADIVKKSLEGLQVENLFQEPVLSKTANLGQSPRDF